MAGAPDLAYWAVVGGVSIYDGSLLLMAAIQESTN
ncbi:hypothetical protein PPTG_23476 [Phytophthora nicotianae INRA-310]|uniref:Uncharacterized protein n=1 Tax=Phytophthora nicotianae (strain INRA-310) TaxID=761204 RepID=W2PXA4_PHYN3|nr:hypothetical protein PPTG_23476 [Phytophthora nicotianae INRA-310]ETN05588.1 hypothetical protein PPTG_23476 [Phytophthora nicotianae INRA-310]